MKNFPQSFSRPVKFLLVGIIVLAVLMVWFGYNELQESRRDLRSSLEAEGATLIEALNTASEINLLSSNEFQRLLTEKLVTVCAHVSDLEQFGALTAAVLKRHVERADVDFLGVGDGKGRIIISSVAGVNRNALVHQELLDSIQSMNRGEVEWIDLGTWNNPVVGRRQYLVAYKRNHRAGFILAGLDAEHILRFRKRIGLGRYIQDIGRNPQIEYVVLQDEYGIISATRGVKEMTSIEGDPFLRPALAGDTLLAHPVTYEGREVLEVVRPLYIEGEFFALTRIGLSTQRTRAILHRGRNRMIIMAVIVVVLGGLAFGFLLVRQRYQILREEHRVVRGYTDRVLDNMADGVVAADNTGKIMVFNKAAEKLFGVNSERVLGKTCRAVIPDTSSIEETLRTGKPIEYEERSYSLGDRNIIAGISTSIIHDADGGVNMVVAVIKDLTEQRRVLAELQRREKLSAMGELAAGVAHEIRNPLNAIGVIAQRFAYEFSPREDEEEFRELVQTVRQEVQRVNEIIKQFLEFARPKPLTLGKVSLSELLQSEIKALESQAAHAGIHLDFTVLQDGEIVVDVNRMQQVLLNLVQNAIEACVSGDRIEVTGEVKNDRVIIAVRDTGKGIPAEHMSKIFNLYFSTRTTGTGLGLSIVHQIISEHGGEITVESEVGKGTEFVITLPRRTGNLNEV
ncbi:MAG: PAS domain S-box protein [Chlorobi bacterium]|nr:PAS domain S-box protein [Chlorobiota bacterium]